VLITFSGLDGAGKSTLINWLKGSLEEQSHRVAVLHMNDHIGLYAYVRFFRDRLFGSREEREPPPRGAPGGNSKPPEGARARYWRIRDAIVWSKLLRRLIYPLDLVVFQFYRLYQERYRGRILIMDRYFYDTLVDVWDARFRFWIRTLERITPEPDVPVFLELQPEVAHARKAEHSVDWLRNRSKAYGIVRPWVRASVAIPNADLDTAKLALEQALQDRPVADA
jgi:hypothetical protein